MLDYEDILSYGTIGLIEALDRYDGSKGVKFETYAMNRIRGAIIDAFRALDRLPRSVRQKARRFDSAHAALLLELGREPTERELAQALDMTLAQYRQALIDCSWVTVSLDTVHERDDQETGTGFELRANPEEENFTRFLERQQTLQSLCDALGVLPEREFLIVSLYYKEGMTLKEIAQVLDVSESRVSQLRERALQRLRTEMGQARAA
jgi:RNA polymerase sigma factor for flagellar operon FliA